jgi:hypothetical protein
VSLEFAAGFTATLHGRTVVVSLGRVTPGEQLDITIGAHVSSSINRASPLLFEGELRSGTALPVSARSVRAKVHRDSDDDHPQ